MLESTTKGNEAEKGDKKLSVCVYIRFQLDKNEKTEINELNY